MRERGAAAKTEFHSSKLKSSETNHDIRQYNELHTSVRDGLTLASLLHGEEPSHLFGQPIWHFAAFPGGTQGVGFS